MVIGCHGLVWAGTFDEAMLAAAAERNRRAGFDLLEIPLLDPYAFDIAAAQRVLGAGSLQVSASLGLPEHADISTAEPDKVRAGEALLIKALEVLSDLDSQHLCGVLYGMLKKYPEPATAAGRASSLEVLSRVADRAEALGITMSLEVVNRYESNLFNTVTGALAFLDDLGNPRIRLHVDTYHMNIEECDLFSPVLAAGDRLGYVHIGESHRGYLGSGTVDFDVYFHALSMIGYDGPIVFESFSTAVVDETLSRSLAVWRNLWDDSDDLGAHACTFIRNKIRAKETIRLH
jgi:D-psicose/D-tagatose/L-ribulose 3-epimerase